MARPVGFGRGYSERFSRPATGSFHRGGGYQALTMQYDHPLALRNHVVAANRAVLYDKIGPGPHACHWIDVYECGKDALDWGGIAGICADHLDGDRGNDDPANLVPSCVACNARRARPNELTAAKVREMRQLAAEGVSYRELGDRYGIRPKSAYHVVTRRSWRNVV